MPTVLTRVPGEGLGDDARVSLSCEGRAGPRSRGWVGVVGPISYILFLRSVSEIDVKMLMIRNFEWRLPMVVLSCMLLFCKILCFEILN